MVFKSASAALLVSILMSAPSIAQTAAQIGGPRELPPPGFTGQQFVDSRGCIFLKAGYGGTVTWVPRVDRNHKALCGLPPTFGPQAPIEMAEDAPLIAVPQAPVAPKVETMPRVAAAQPARRAAPAIVVPEVTLAVAPPPALATAANAAVSASLRPGQIGCFASAPVPMRVALRGGGTVVVCTPGDGTLTGWRSPIYPAPAGVGAALSDTGAMASAGSAGIQYAPPAARIAAPATNAVAASTAVIMPKGYKLAWKDDRLNPLRGRGTAQGQASQDQVWTRTIPAQVTYAREVKPVIVTGSTVTLSTKSAPTAQVAASGNTYIQIGSFGVPANANGAAARLTALGLPVSTSSATRGGKALQTVFAGPFGSNAAAQAALISVHNAGFADAFIR